MERGLGIDRPEQKKSKTRVPRREEKTLLKAYGIKKKNGK